MELATQALGSLLPKLGTLLTGEYKLQKGVRGEIQFLQVEMESMQAVLNMLSKLPAHQITELDKIWVRNLKELSYDIEDSVDIFMVRIDTPVSAKPHSFKRFFDKIIGLLTKAKIRHHVANDIDDIKRRIREVADRRERYKFECVAAHPDTATVDPRVLASFEHAANLVGTDVRVEKISSLLTKGKDVPKQKNRMVVSIFGIGGLGKTTVANLVYERLGGQFDCQAFISVSLRPNMKQILSSILRQISKDKCTNAGEKEADELIRSIRQFLEDKRYLIVIDDVWSEEAWKIIGASLIDNNLGSRVIVTTRNVEVANLSSLDDGAMYELDPLSYQDSKNLLSKRIFKEEEGILSELEEVTKKILKKCGGIPLAIITIASMLASMPNKTNLEWYDVYKSMGSGLERDKSFKNMREILYLSYSDLPFYLKPCLLYLSMFPEDCYIPREKLIRLWVAEGFIDAGERGSNLYELGERYFNELVNRSMIQPIDFESGTARVCLVHDMILDLIISLSTQENFATISEGPNLKSPAGKIRQLSLQENQVYIDVGYSMEEKVTANVSQVRTLIALGNAFQWMPPLSKFSVLRVLVLLCNCNIKGNIKGIGSLHHLRYLELSGMYFGTEVLEEIGNLKHLKILDLSDVDRIELPASIVKLEQLEYLITNNRVRFPDGIGDLVSLQQLEGLDAVESPHTLAELGNLTGLQVLSVQGLTESCDKTFLRSLSTLHNLRILKVTEGECSLDCIPDQWSSPTRLQRVNAELPKLPQWFTSLSELSCLSIRVNILKQDDIQLLGALPMLCRLDVYGDVITEERLVIGTDQPFRALKYFNFQHSERCWLVFARGVMPKLQRLELVFDARERAGGGFDVGLENLTSLKLVEVIINCYDAIITEVEDVEAKCRDTIHMHPNHPTLELTRIEESHMLLVDEKGGARITEVEDAEAKWRDTIHMHPNHPTLQLKRRFESLVDNSEASEQQSSDDERDNGSEVSEHRTCARYKEWIKRGCLFRSR